MVHLMGETPPTGGADSMHPYTGWMVKKYNKTRGSEELSPPAKSIVMFSFYICNVYGIVHEK